MKTIKFIGIIIVAAIVAAVVTVAVDTLEVFSYRYAFVAVYAATAICVAALLGVFDEKERKQPDGDSIRHKMGRKSYGQAAIFMGTACVFVGTPKECEERADDLWHYGQQVRVEENIDGMEFDIL